MGCTSDCKAEEHAVQFDNERGVVRGYCGKGWDGVADAEGPGRIVRGLSGEVAKTLMTPARCVSFNTFTLVTISDNINRPRSRRKRLKNSTQNLKTLRKRLLPRCHCRPALL